MDAGDITLILFYAMTLALAWFCWRPKLVFWLTICLGLVACCALFHYRVYLELGGLAHTLPYAWLARMLSGHRAKRRSRRSQKARIEQPDEKTV
jgi:hypothetical protein